MIKVENLHYRYPNGRNVLDGISFNIAKGEFVALIGQNGSGKSTLLKQLNGLLKPSQGRVIIDGLDVTEEKVSTLARHIGFLFQNPDHQIFCNTVREEIAFGLKNTGIHRDETAAVVNEYAAKVGISDLLDKSPFALSKGQRQKVALASVLAMRTDILVLDEPTTGQDYRECIEIMDILAELNSQGKTIITVTHDMELAACYTRRVIILLNGKILEDGPSHTVLKNKESLERSNLTPPQIYMLAERFHKKGLFEDVYTAEAMFKELAVLLGGFENACTG